MDHQSPAQEMFLTSEFESLKADCDWRDAELVRLADFIASRGFAPGDGGVVDNAIRIIRGLQAKVELQGLKDG